MRTPSSHYSEPTHTQVLADPQALQGGMIYGFASRRIKEDIAASIFARIVQRPDRTRQTLHPRCRVDLVDHRRGGAARRRLAPVRICDGVGGGVGVFPTVRNCERPRSAPIAGGTRSWFQPGPIDGVLRRERQQPPPAAATDAKGARK